MDYILSIHRVYRLKYLIGCRFFRHSNLSALKHAMQFFLYKNLLLLRRFSYYSRRGGNLPPAKNAKHFSAIHCALRGYNRGETAC